MDASQNVVGGPVKVMTRERLLEVRAQARHDGRRVVQCHGCFDIVHPGHIRHLRQAKSLGDVLLVTITGDATIAKGTGRPLIPEELRAENLAALDFVDWVYIEQRPTASELLEDVRPDVYVKGREYEFNADPRFAAERSTVERHGGRVVFSSGDVVFSSTALIAAMEQSIDPYHHRLAQLTQADELQPTRLNQLLGDFRGKRVVVVGETIFDTYVLCDRPDVAGESPILTLRPVERRHYDGGAAVIARHVAALGGFPTLVTALPENDEADALRRRLLAEGVQMRILPVRGAIPEKQRFLVGQQKVFKLDLLEPMLLDAKQNDDLLALASDACADGPGAHAAIVADFGLGMFSARLAATLCRTVRPLVKVLSGDVSGRRSNLTAFRDMDLLCPSESELRDATRRHGEGLPAVAWQFMEESKTKSLITTMGAEGLIAFDRLPGGPAENGRWDPRLRSEHVPALCPLAIDPLGCGDSLLAAATMALASGGTLLQAAFLGAAAAGCQVQRLGNTPVSATDLRRTATRVHGAHLTYAAADVIDTRPGRAAVAG
jgi:rfaE bifunctional protein nucleotidyltransferase chain/domain